MLCLRNANIKLDISLIKIIETILKQRGLLVYYSTGSGKTLGAIGSAVCLMETFPDITTLVVTPTSLTANFKKEMIKFGLSPDDSRFTFLTFGQMVKRHASGDICSNKILICDEAHYLKTNIVKSRKQGTGILAKTMIECAKKAFRVLLLTATPIINSRRDIVNLIAMVDGTDPLTKTQFDNIVEDRILLKEYLSNKILYYQRNKNDANFPTVHEEDIILTMPQSFYNEYHKIELNQKKIKDLIDAKDVFQFLSGVRRAMNVADLENGSPKIDYVINVVLKGDSHNHGIGPTLIYSAWKGSGIHLIAKKLQLNNIPYTEVNGDLSAKKRDEAVKDYNSGKVRVLLITNAGGVGLDLKNTKYVIILDPTWNDGSEKQITGRGGRYQSHQGVDKNVYVIKLYMQKPSIGLLSGRKWNDNIICFLKIM